MAIKEMTSEDLRTNILSTYFTLRMGIVVLSAALPLSLYFYSQFAQGGLDEHSMSAFYGAYNGAMRGPFVGILWAVGAFLVLYKGFSPLEDWLLNLAGVFAIATAMIPCGCWIGQAEEYHNKVHVTVAVLFFVCVAAVVWFCAEDTVTLLPTAALQKRYKALYRGIAFALALSPVAAIAVSYVSNHYVSRTFYIEAGGVFVFAFYWLVKSTEFRLTSAEKRALRGELKNVKGYGLVPAGAAMPPKPPS